MWPLQRNKKIERLRSARQDASDDLNAKQRELSKTQRDFPEPSPNTIKRKKRRLEGQIEQDVRRVNRCTDQLKKLGSE